jgi:hypothetical protein
MTTFQYPALWALMAARLDAADVRIIGQRLPGFRCSRGIVRNSLDLIIQVANAIDSNARSRIAGTRAHGHRLVPRPGRCQRKHPTIGPADSRS